MTGDTSSDNELKATLQALKSLFGITESTTMMSHQARQAWCRNLDAATLARLAAVYRRLDVTSIPALRKHLYEMMKVRRTRFEALKYGGVFEVFRVLGQHGVAPFVDQTVIHAYDQEPSEGWGFLPTRFQILIPLGNSIGELPIGAPLSELSPEWHARLRMLALTFTKSEMEELYSLATRSTHSREDRLLYLLFVRIDSIRYWDANGMQNG